MRITSPNKCLNRGPPRAIVTLRVCRLCSSPTPIRIDQSSLGHMRFTDRLRDRGTSSLNMATDQQTSDHALVDSASGTAAEPDRCTEPPFANPNVQDNTGETPLSSAECSGNKRIVEMLIKAGAKAEPGAALNGGSATGLGSPGAAEGPPSVS